MAVAGLLARLFLEARRSRPRPGDIDWAQERDLEGRLRSLWEAGRAAWPAIDQPEAALMQALAERAQRMEDLDPARGPDWYIATACATGQRGAVGAFEARFFPELDRALGRLRLAQAELDEVKQNLRDELFVAEPERAPKIASYAGRGELAGWLRVTAVRAALKLRRGSQPGLSLEDEGLLERVPVASDDPDLSYMKELYRPAFKAAFQEALESLSPREQNFLRQHLIDGLSTEQLGALYQVHKATAARWVAAARELLVKRTWAAFRRRVHLSQEECESLMRLIHSQIDATLRRRLSEIS